MIANNRISRIECLDNQSRLEELILENNAISAISGIPSSLCANIRAINLKGNSLTSVAFLARCVLPNLEYLNVSHNQLSRVELFDPSSNKGCINLIQLDISHNLLSNLPNLSGLLELTTLYLDNNKISTITDAAQNLPSSLEVLSLSKNKLARLQEFSFITALENLRELEIEGNPIVDMASKHGFNYRPYILFLLNQLTKLCNVNVTAKELDLCSHLFCESDGNLSDSLLQLLRPGEDAALLAYLQQTLPLEAQRSPSQVLQPSKNNTPHASKRLVSTTAATSSKFVSNNSSNLSNVTPIAIASIDKLLPAVPTFHPLPIKSSVPTPMPNPVPVPSYSLPSNLPPPLAPMQPPYLYGSNFFPTFDPTSGYSKPYLNNSQVAVPPQTYRPFTEPYYNPIYSTNNNPVVVGLNSRASSLTAKNNPFTATSQQPTTTSSINNSLKSPKHDKNQSSKSSAGTPQESVSISEFQKLQHTVREMRRFLKSEYLKNSNGVSDSSGNSVLVSKTLSKQRVVIPVAVIDYMKVYHPTWQQVLDLFPIGNYSIPDEMGAYAGSVFLFRCASRIQGVWRGYRTRLAMRRHMLSNVSAIKIQSLWRGHHCRMSSLGRRWQQRRDELLRMRMRRLDRQNEVLHAQLTQLNTAYTNEMQARLVLEEGVRFLWQQMQVLQDSVFTMDQRQKRAAVRVIVAFWRKYSLRKWGERGNRNVKLRLSEGATETISRRAFRSSSETDVPAIFITSPRGASSGGMNVKITTPQKLIERIESPLRDNKSENEIFRLKANDLSRRFSESPSKVDAETASKMRFEKTEILSAGKGSKPELVISPSNNFKSPSVSLASNSFSSSTPTVATTTVTHDSESPLSFMSESILDDLRFDKVIVEIIGCKNLNTSVCGGTIHPYAVLSFQDSIGQTEFVSKTINPEFNTNFSFNVDMTPSEETGFPLLELMIELRSRHTTNNYPTPFDLESDEDNDLDPVLGLVVIDMKKFENQPRSKMSLPVVGLLQNGRQATGSLAITVWWLRNLPDFVYSQQPQLRALCDSEMAEMFHGISVSSLLVNVMNLALDNPSYSDNSIFYQMEFQQSMFTSEDYDYSDMIALGKKTSFDVQDQEAFLNFSLVSRSHGTVECLGTLSISLEDLKDHKPHMTWYEFVPKIVSGSPTRAGRICLWLCWLQATMSDIVQASLNNS